MEVLYDHSQSCELTGLNWAVLLLHVTLAGAQSPGGPVRMECPKWLTHMAFQLRAQLGLSIGTSLWASHCIAAGFQEEASQEQAFKKAQATRLPMTYSFGSLRCYFHHILLVKQVTKANSDSMESELNSNPWWEECAYKERRKLMATIFFWELLLQSLGTKYYSIKVHKQNFRKFRHQWKYN